MMAWIRKPEYLLLAALLVLLLVLSFLSQGYYGGADNINHYFISRYSFHYPVLFFNAWGRPLYTILSSPFAQFGFQGIKVFNVLLGILTAWLLMKTARELKVNPPWMAVIILCFTPLYLVMLFTAMTEILFGFVLVLSAYLFFTRRYIAAAIVISFLPFARAEGYFIILPLFIGLLLRRQWKAVPFLGLGMVFFSVVGGIYFRDLFWVKNHFPYGIIHPVYHSSGSFWTFTHDYQATFGWAITILMCLGAVMLLANLFSGNREKRILAAEMILMFLLPALLYYFFHSYIYYKGLYGSIGLVRVVTGILPLTAMIALYGFSFFSRLAGSRKWLRWAFNFIAIAVIVFIGFNISNIPVSLGTEEKLIKEADDWVEANYKPLPYFMYTDFNVPYFLHTDPYDGEKSRQVWGTLKSIRLDAIFIWDAHFGPNECKIPLDSLMRHPYMRLVKYFKPNPESITFGGYPYEVYIFKTSSEGGFDNYDLRQALIDERDKNLTPLARKVFDFETALPGYDTRIISDKVASGKHAFMMDKNTEFSPGLLFQCRDLNSLNQKIRVKAKVKMYSDVPFAKNPAMLVITIEDHKGSYFYKALYTEKMDFAAGKWNNAFEDADLPLIHSKDDVIKVYVWHPGKSDLIIDDLIIDILAKPKDIR